MATFHQQKQDTQHSVKKLLDFFASISPREQKIVFLAAIFFAPARKTDFEHCLAKTDQYQNDADDQAGETLSNSFRRLQNLNLLDWRLQCNPQIVEIVSRKAVQLGCHQQLATVVRQEMPIEDEQQQKSIRCLRDVRIGLYNNDFDLFNRSLFKYYQCPDIPESAAPLAAIFNNPFDAQWFSTLPVYLQLHGLREIFQESLIRLTPCQGPLDFLLNKERDNDIPAGGESSFYYLLISQLILQGKIAESTAMLNKAGEYIHGFGLRGWLAFFQGHNSRAIDFFNDDLNELQKNLDQKDAYFAGLEGFFFILALLNSGEYSFNIKIKEIIVKLNSSQANPVFMPAYNVMAEVADFQTTFSETNYCNSWQAGGRNSITALLQGMAHFWINGYLETEQKEEIALLFRRASESGYGWPAREYAELLSRSSPKNTYREFCRVFRNRNNIISIISACRREERWQRALKALNLVASPTRGKGRLRSRLAWMVNFEHGFVTISPKEQKLSSKGQWSLGRPVALQRIYSGKNLDFISNHDQKIRATLKKHKIRAGISYDFDMSETLPALIGHPHLFLAEAPTVAVEFVQGEPELRIKENNNELHIELYPDLMTDKVMATRETPTRFAVMNFSKEHQKIAAIIGDDGLSIPGAARKEVIRTIEKLASCITVHSAIGGVAKDTEKVAADARIIIHLLPMGAGFRLTMLVRPFSSDGPYVRPGQGSENIIAEIAGERFQTRRNLVQEVVNCQKIETACPTLSMMDNSDWEWEINKTEECLQLLLELEEIKDQITIEWPEGQKISLGKQVSFEHFQLKIRKKNNWFELQGKLEIDEDKVIDMQHLLSLVRTHPGKFIPLDDQQFIILSRQFRKQLEELNLFSEEHGKKIRLHPLAALSLAGLDKEKCEPDADQHWHQMIHRLQESRKLRPRVPSTLQAELRDYQSEGFCWLAGLAHLGAGACLADDMGLGKTLQGLAIMLEKANQGPSLVVAPTSVCLNWQEEIKRFAPTLNDITFGGRNRAKQLSSLQPFDVVISSYGLLQQEIELLNKINWQVIVLDEAQAIKNITTKRSKAAMSLKGEFKLITTGTPIENHLGELWNLFHFINPGLLGTLEQFNKKYGHPIERYQNRQVQRKLKKLIQPFILRRLKSQVLEELPPRTEVLLQVEMSEDELAFYEVLRRNAVEKISDNNGPPGSRHLQILAEIMKLRRICCHPRLVAPESEIKSSKLAIFAKIIEELLENRHKALVFSQFVDHLHIISEFLDDKKITYCYLDGNTPAKVRRQQISAFQNGAGDLFLISLKAGGVGLNLTAADYVIHMDPWWNPAVEDQASDRAHRLGQKRPVTIYRLVTKNSIEEKIVKLHQAKRTLADSLLDNTDMGGKLDAEELLRLIRER